MTTSSKPLARRLSRLVLAVFALGMPAFLGCGGGAVREEKVQIEQLPVHRAHERDGPVERDIGRVRAATSGFRVLDSAVAAGYPREVRDCLAHESHGAMGFHHVNRTLVDDRVEVERPEILLFARSAAGEYKLNGVEYIVPYRVVPRDREPPVVMGQKLKQSDSLALWYLHVWIWQENPAGLFADWNPVVKC